MTDLETQIRQPLEVTQNGEAMKKYREEVGIEIH